MQRPLLALALAFVCATPAAAQTYEFANLGFRFEAPTIYDVVQEGITVTVAYDGAGDVIEITPFAVTDRNASREERVVRWFEAMDYELSGSEEVRGDGSVLVTGEGGDLSTFVMVRDVYVDSDGGLRIVVYADPSDHERVLEIASSIEITDPTPLLNAARTVGRID